MESPRQQHPSTGLKTLDRWLGGPGGSGRANTQGQCCPSNSPQSTCALLQPQAKAQRIPMANGLPCQHWPSLHLYPEGWLSLPPCCSLPHGAAGPHTQHLQSTCSGDCQPRGGPKYCLFKLTFWGQESYFQLFQRQCFHCSLSASTGGRDALLEGAMAGSFVLGCGAQHQLCTPGSSSSLLCCPVPGPTGLGRTREDIPGFPDGQEGQEHPIWEARGRAQEACSCLRPSQHQQLFFYTP